VTGQLRVPSIERHRAERSRAAGSDLAILDLSNVDHRPCRPSCHRATMQSRSAMPERVPFDVTDYERRIKTGRRGTFW